jgi:hypothetical protein
MCEHEPSQPYIVDRAPRLAAPGIDPGREQSGWRHDPPVAAWYCWTMSAGMRPRSLSATPWSLAQARMSALRLRMAAVRPGRCRTQVPAPAGVFDVGGELPAETGGVAGVQIDFGACAVDPEPDGLIRRAALEAVFYEDGYLRCHRGLRAGDGLLARY